MTEDPRTDAKELLKRHLTHTHSYYLGFDKTPDEEIERIVDLIVKAALQEVQPDIEEALGRASRGQRFRASRGI